MREVIATDSASLTRECRLIAETRASKTAGNVVLVVARDKEAAE